MGLGIPATYQEKNQNHFVLCFSVQRETAPMGIRIQIVTLLIPLITVSEPLMCEKTMGIAFLFNGSHENLL